MSEPAPQRRTVTYTAWQVRRVITLLAWLHHHPEATLMAAAAQFGVSVPQLKHELTQASTCGVPPYVPGSLLEISTSGMHAEVTWSLGLDRAPCLTESETGAVLLSVERLASVLSTDDRSRVTAVASTVRTIQQAHRDRRENFTPDAFTRPVNRPERSGDHSGAATAATPHGAVLSVLRDALRLRRWVSLTYRSLSSDSVGDRNLIPDHLEYIDGDGYLWARTAEDGEQRCFSVSRMSGVAMTTRAAPRAVARVIDEHDPFGFDREDQDWAELELEDDAGWMFEYLPMWQIDEPGPLRAMIPDTGDWLERFLIARAPQIRRVVPPVTDATDGRGTEGDGDLAHRTARRASAALDAYRRLA